VRPQLFHERAAALDKTRTFWVNASGGALKPEQFSEQLRQAFNEFNPDLNVTAINFRRMTVTALFASMYLFFFNTIIIIIIIITNNNNNNNTERVTKKDSETQEEFYQRHANLLNVSKNVMDAHYNR